MLSIDQVILIQKLVLQASQQIPQAC